MKKILFFLLVSLWASLALAKVREYHLVLEERPVTIEGRTMARAMTVNGKIPGPTLYFEEGDYARIHVENRMSEESSVHWHGLLVPPGMDGVPYVSFPPIKPGETFTYEFPIRQAGTYWYHSHTDLQEQKGVYGAIVIKPREERFQVDRDYVLVLSDWSFEEPGSILRTLKAGREWYSIKKGSAQSLLSAAHQGMIARFFKRELLRMPPMDISDIAYDHFLINGRPERSLPARPGETIRLRIVSAGLAQIFTLSLPAVP